mgnify:CR=1 FL=1
MSLQWLKVGWTSTFTWRPVMHIMDLIFEIWSVRPSSKNFHCWEIDFISTIWYLRSQVNLHEFPQITADNWKSSHIPFICSYYKITAHSTPCCNRVQRPVPDFKTAIIAWFSKKDYRTWVYIAYGPGSALSLTREGQWEGFILGLSVEPHKLEATLETVGQNQGDRKDPCWWDRSL